MPENRNYELISIGNLVVSVVDNRYEVKIGDVVYKIEEQKDNRLNIRVSSWNNLFFTFDGKTLTVYSSLSKIYSLEVSSISLSGEFVVGRKFNGCVNVLRFYNKAVSFEDLKQYVWRSNLNDSITGDIATWITCDIKNNLIDLKNKSTSFVLRGLCLPMNAAYGVRVIKGDMCLASDIGIVGNPAVVYIRFFSMPSIEKERVLFTIDKFCISLKDNGEGSQKLFVCDVEIPGNVSHYIWHDVAVFANIRQNQIGYLVRLDGEKLWVSGVHLPSDYSFPLSSGEIIVGNSSDGNKPFYNGCISSVAIYEVSGMRNDVGNVFERLHEHGPGSYDSDIKVLYNFGVKMDLVQDTPIVLKRWIETVAACSFKINQSNIGPIFGLNEFLNLSSRYQRATGGLYTVSADDPFAPPTPDSREKYTTPLDDWNYEKYKEVSTAENSVLFIEEEEIEKMSLGIAEEFSESIYATKLSEACPFESTEIVISKDVAEVTAKKKKHRHHHEKLLHARYILGPEVILGVFGMAAVAYLLLKLKIHNSEILWDATRDTKKAEDQIRVSYRKLQMPSHAIKWFDADKNKTVHSQAPIAWIAGGRKEPQLFCKQEYVSGKEMIITLSLELYPPLSVSKKFIDLDVKKISVTMEALDKSGAIVDKFIGEAYCTAKRLPSQQIDIQLRGTVKHVSNLSHFVTEYRIQTKIEEVIGIGPVQYCSNSLVTKLDIYMLGELPSLPYHLGINDPRHIGGSVLPYANPDYYLDASIMKIIARRPIFNIQNSEGIFGVDADVINVIKEMKNTIIRHNQLEYDGNEAYRQYQSCRDTFCDGVYFKVASLNINDFYRDLSAKDRVPVDCNICSLLLANSIRYSNLYRKHVTSFILLSFNRENEISGAKEMFSLRRPVYIPGRNIGRNEQGVTFGSHTVLCVYFEKDGSIFDATCIWIDDYGSESFASLSDSYANYLTFAIDDNNALYRYPAKITYF